jgi:arabinofuranan 3-O-arabinosyltransferase
VFTCDPIALPAGTHRIETVSGLTSGIDVDRITLTTAEADGGGTPAVEISRTRLTRTATVAACPAGCWLIMGEGQNPGWSASVGGATATSSTPLSGGMNGWWVPASSTPTVVQIEWTAQTTVTVALVISVLAIGLCLYLSLRRRPGSQHDLHFAPAPPRLFHAVLVRSSWKVSVFSGLVLVGAAWLIGSTGTAEAAAVLAVMIVVLRRPRLAGVAAAVLMAFLSAWVLLSQRDHGYFANAGWPGHFEHLHLPGMLVVALLLASVIESAD